MMGYPDHAKGVAHLAPPTVRYGLSLGLVAIALGLARLFLHFHLPQTFIAFALSAIAVTFWNGGIKPGILAAVTASIVRIYFSEPELNVMSRGVYYLVFLLFALLMSRATRARDELEERVAERTAELTRANEDLNLEIAERKRAEEKLRQSEAYLADAQKLAHTGSWVWQVTRRDALHLSEEWYRIYGFQPEHGVPVWRQRLQRVHPDDRARWQEVIDRAIKEKSGYELEFRILLSDGAVKYIHTVGHAFLKAD